MKHNGYQQVKKKMHEVIELHGEESVLWIGSKGNVLQLSECSLFIKLYLDNDLVRKEYLHEGLNKMDDTNIYKIDIPKRTKIISVELNASESSELQSIYISLFEKEIICKKWQKDRHSLNIS